MDTYCAVLKYHERRNCFGYLQRYPGDAGGTAAIQANGTSPSIYNVMKCKNPEISCTIEIFTPSGRSCSPQVLLLINKIFADVFGFCENEEVILQKLDGAPACSSFDVKLSSSEDWNIVQNSSQRIEELLLGQLQLISIGQKYPIWVTENIFIYFTVVRIEVSSSLKQNACINEFTEVHVKPFCLESSDLGKMNGPKDNLEVLPASFTYKIQRLFADTTTMPFTSRISDYIGDVNTRIKARLLPEMLFCDIFPKGLDILAVFTLNRSPNNSETITVSTVGRRNGWSVYALFFELSECCSRFPQLAGSLKRYDSRYCVFSPALYRSILGQYEWIKISHLSRNNICKAEVLEVISENGLPEDFDGCLKNHFRMKYQHYPIIIPPQGIKVEVELSNGTRVKYALLPEQTRSTEKDNEPPKCFYFTNDTFPELKLYDNVSPDHAINYIERLDVVVYPALNFGSWKNEAIKFACQTSLIEKCYGYIMYYLQKTTALSWGNILITGDKFTGKTTVLQLLAQKLLHSHLAVYSHYMCMTIDGETPTEFESSMETAVEMLKKCQPSVLFLDNLDFFLHNEDEDMRNVKLERFAQLIRNMVNMSETLVVATAYSKREVMELFSLNAGGRFFSHVESIKGLSVAEREECLEKFCKSEMEICSLRSAAEATEKCTVGDLKRLAQKILLEARARGHENVEEDDVQRVLVNFLLNAIPIEQSKSRDTGKKLNWDDVGGLKNVKQILTEVFVWPTKYPQLYRNSSIRLGRGVLLYGPSGCGKTLIARVLAAQCSFNVTTVKGPELLSKYVGECEENVRKTFERARAASPSLIFFDEFDSLGRKRGVADTGVTDRVVNQLLTELDGVEGLEGVYVLAATNRIDLIDSALLRPGRFDYVVKCELPKKDDRKSILDILCCDVNLEKDVDLEAIAAATDGWTGADLKGLVTNAQLIAYKRMKGALNDMGTDLDENSEYTLSQTDLLSAMLESQPKKNRSSDPDKKRYLSPGMLTTLA